MTDNKLVGRRYNKLSHMKINEISVCDEPASPGAYIILAKSKNHPEPSVSLPELIAKSDAGALTEEDILIAMTVKGDAAEILKAIEDGELRYIKSNDPNIVDKIWRQYGDHRTDAEKQAA